MSILCISDNKQNKLNIIDVEELSIIHSLDVGQSPYPVDQVSADTVFVSTRGESSVLPVNFKEGVVGAAINLPHRPRSSTRHKSNPLALVAGVESSQTSVVDSGSMQVLFSVGKADTDTRRDFGGGLACGHPAWIGDNHFLHLDRIARRVELYDYQSKDMVSSINLSTSPHHVVIDDDSIFVMCEGNRASLIPPSVAKLRIDNSSIIVEFQMFLPIPFMSYSTTGGHHLTIDSINQRVYVGTADARLYTLDSSDLGVLNYIDTGKGCGHVTICHEIGLGIATNHSDTFMSLFELSTGRRVGSIEVSSAQAAKNKTQGHTSKWFSSNRRFYTSAAQDGKILEIDPVTRSITNDLSINGAYLIQGCFI